MTISDYQITTYTTEPAKRGSVMVVSADLCHQTGFLNWLLQDTQRALGTNHVEWSIRPIFQDETPTTHSGQQGGD